MCYEEENHDLATFDGVKVKVLGQLNESLWQIADVYVEDGNGIELLMKIAESARSDWDDLSYEVSTVGSIDSVIQDELHKRRKWALVRVFYDEFKYKCLDEKGRHERLKGIADITGQPTQIDREYMALLYQVDESLVPDDWKRFVDTYPQILDDRDYEQMRKCVNE